MHRSPARFLAPLALVGFAVALALVVSSSTRDDEQPASGTTTLERTAERGRNGGREERRERRRRRGRTYTVRSGDTPSGIADKTGVPLETLEELNPDLDPQSLNVGDKLRIR